MSEKFDAVVIGGGFYGCVIAVYLAKQRKLRRVLLAEREDKLLQRASYNNQARIHNGYHYPRSFTTAYRSRINLPRFVEDWPAAVKTDFSKIYAIARNNSKVTPRQFQRFCEGIGAQLDPVDAEVRRLFEPRLIEGLFVVREYAFNTTELNRWAVEQLSQAQVEVHMGTIAESIRRSGAECDVDLRDAGGQHMTVKTRNVFNCSYSGLNQLGGDFHGVDAQLKHELTEMALVQPPPELQNIGITVMDGPFFSMMPFPARGLHTLSHVRYTPHFSWQDQQGKNPYEVLENYPRESRVDRMMRDVQRYIPAVHKSAYKDSLFEVKTILQKNEGDDGRPILFQKHLDLPGCYSILGAKIDNIYDVIEKLDATAL